MKDSIINGIVNDGLCLGCGLCESVCGKENVEMQLQADGFFKPFVKVKSNEGERIIEKICPGTNIINDLTFDKKSSVWGKIERLCMGNSTDSEIRTKGSSGGMASAIAISMLQNGIVDGILQVGGDSNDYERNQLKVSHSREDVLSCASSRYAPALIFDKIFDLFNDTNKVYAFIGKPCDISALKNLLNQYPQYKNRIKLTISIMCAGMPSFEGTKAIINDFKAQQPVNDLVYRGNGWPGFFSFNDANKRHYQMTYNDSWGKVLGKYLNFRCKLCPDGIGLQADVVVGDAWETKDGYPDFTEKEGRSLVIARTAAGVEILNDLGTRNEAVYEDLAEEKLRLIQPYQYARRTNIGARVIAFYLVKRRWLNFRNLFIYHNLSKAQPRNTFREFKGTLKRIKKNK